jgi:hypothetical protein
MKVIPGADALGFGFDVLKAYDTASITQQLLEHKTEDAGTYTWGNETFAVPDNTAVLLLVVVVLVIVCF